MCEPVTPDSMETLNPQYRSNDIYMTYTHLFMKWDFESQQITATTCGPIKTARTGYHVVTRAHYRMRLNFRGTKLSRIANLLNIREFYFRGCWERMDMVYHKLCS